MSILNQLASALNRRDEVPNQMLAQKILDTKDAEAIEELVANLKNKNKAIQNDCIKVLYEISKQDPKMIVPHMNTLVRLLDSKNNRLQWGILTAIDAITLEIPEKVYAALSEVLRVADKGSVITKDHAVGVLIKLSTVEKYRDQGLTLLVEQILKSPANQLPMYAERALPVVTENHKDLFIRTLSSRLADVEKDTKRKRIEKVIKKLTS